MGNRHRRRRNTISGPHPRGNMFRHRLASQFSSLEPLSVNKPSLENNQQLQSAQQNKQRNYAPESQPHQQTAYSNQMARNRKRRMQMSRSMGEETSPAASTWQQFLDMHNYEPFIHGSSAENTSRLHQKRRNSIAFGGSLFLEPKKVSKNPLKRFVNALRHHLLPTARFGKSDRHTSPSHPSPIFSSSFQVGARSPNPNASSSHKRQRRASMAETSSRRRRSLLKKTHSSRRILGFVDEIDVIDGKKSPAAQSSVRRVSFDSIEMLSERRMERQRSRERDQLLQELQRAKEEKTGKKPTYLCQGNVIINRGSFNDNQRTIRESIDFMKRCEQSSRQSFSPTLDTMGGDVIIHHIFVFLDWFTLEKVGYTCKAMFYYSSSNFLWKRLTIDVMQNRQNKFHRLCQQFDRKKSNALGFWKEQFFTYTPNFLLYNQQKRLINHSFYIHARDGEYLTKEQALKAFAWLGLKIHEEEVDHILTPEGTIDFQLFSSFTWRHERDFPEDAVNIRCRRIFYRLCRPDCSVLFIQDVTSRATNLRWNPEFLRAIVELINKTREDALSPSSRYISYEEFQHFFVDEQQERFHNSTFTLI
eukprot:CAMPEP_0117444374 /NCGR_PEP_ID=MMETSP0759-20121206/5208_1 /TAXON_ID=63605 /ORGANISM="Percolomonas cosmopolitus, Strain WS" /LENGTH=587 /DNA_ID=CAMNT_0005236439 /DNA_START=309 /DNA_END=2072 /DNA_ORIENTATION=-